jgi:hypothetical protein
MRTGLDRDGAEQAALIARPYITPSLMVGAGSMGDAHLDQFSDAL